MVEINQLNLPALFTAAQAVKRSQLEIDQLQGAAGRRERIAGLTTGAARGNQAQATELAGLDPSRANDATEFFKTNVLPVVLSEAEGVRDSTDFAGSYSTFVGKLKQSGLVDPDDPPPDQPDKAFIDRFIAEGQALQGKEVKAVNPVNLKFPDGTVQGFDPRDPALKEALKQPGVIEFGVQDTVAGATKPPSGNRVDEIKADLSLVNRARSRLSIVRESIVDKRSRAGVAGSISRFAQRAVGIAGDLADLGIDVPGFNRGVVDEVAQDINSGRADEGIGTFFDSQNPINDVFVNGLAYTLAKSRKGPGRLNTDDVKRALPDVQITGLRSVDEVLARLEAVDKELAASAEDLGARLNTSSTGGPPKFRVDADGNLVRVD